MAPDVMYALGAFHVHEAAILGHQLAVFQQAVNDQKECFAQFRRSALGGPCTRCLMGTGLVSAKVNARKGRNGVSVCKPGPIPKLHHELGAKRISHTVHDHEAGYSGS